MNDKKSVLILCTANSARSQMAEGLLKHMCRNEFVVESAGTRSSAVRPEAIAVLREIGIDISGNRSKSVEEFARRNFDYVITVCDDARKNCPYFPAKTRSIHRSFDDPATIEGDEQTRLIAFRRVRDEIEKYLRQTLENKVIS